MVGQSHNKKLIEDNISEKLFENTRQFKDEIVYVDQDILNYTFRDKIVWLSPVYNAQVDLWRPGTCAHPIYTPEEVWWAKHDPAIVHYNGSNKPWNTQGYRELRKYQPFINEYFKNLNHSPYKYRHWKKLIKNYIYNKEETDGGVTVRILFLKLKKNKPLKTSLFLQKINYVNSHLWHTHEGVKYIVDRVAYMAKVVWIWEGEHFERRMQKIEDMINQANEHIGYLSERVRMCGNVPEMLYFNPQESFLIRNFTEQYHGMEKRESFLALIKSLDDNSVDILSKCLKRIDLIEQENYQQLDLYTEEEKILFNDIKKNFWQKILQLDDNIFCYRHYILPKNDFEVDVFYERYGLEKLENREKLANKDVIDAGAYIGDSSLLLQEYTRGKVYAFEPQTENYHHLQETIQLNHSTKIIPEKFALSDKCGEDRISIEGLASSIAPISQCVEYESVKTITIDSYVQRHHLNVGLIKLDVEGLEQKVLQGALETIKSQRPALLVSIYHNPRDFFGIKPWIDNLDLNYSFKVFKPANMAVLAGMLLIAEPRS